MKAPDKMFVAVYPNYDLDGEHLADDWTDHTVQDCKNITYIRKYALLEWVKEIAENASWVSIDAVVNKIESL